MTNKLILALTLTTYCVLVSAQDAETTAKRSLEIAASICVYTNGNAVMEVIGSD